MPCQQGRSTGAQNGGRLSVLRQFFCLKQFKKRLFIVLYEIPDIRSALLDDGVPLGFQLHFLRFRAAGVFGVQLAVCFQCAPVRRFVGGPLETGPSADGDKNFRCDGGGKIRLVCRAHPPPAGMIVQDPGARNEGEICAVMWRDFDANAEIPGEPLRRDS